MPIRYFLLIAAALLLGTPLAAQQKKKPVETPKPAAKPKPAPAPAKEPEAYAYLLVTTDLEVNISVNFSKAYRVSPQDEGRRIPLEQGGNLVKISPADGGDDGYTDEININSKGNIIRKIELKAKRDAKAAELVEEKRKAEEAQLAEQRRQAEEARRPGMINDPLAGAFILVKGGMFTMGCTSEQNNCGDDERPVQTVTLGDYYIGQTEVTLAQFKAFINETGYKTDAERQGTSWINTGIWKEQSGVDWRCDETGRARAMHEGNHPVIHVSWNDAVAYAEWLSRKSGGRYRLPTEAEWEYAARGGSQSRRYQYAGSNNLDEVAWYFSNSGNTTHPVKGKIANELGLYDMSGNVWEWCADWYGSYSSGSQTNPAGPAAGSRRVLRGGSWSDIPAFCRVAHRDSVTPDYRNGYLGFRLARTP